MGAERTLRRWQAECLPLATEWLDDPTDKPVIRAIMGAGKSEVIKRLAQHAAGKMPVVVATSRRRLVRQLERDLNCGVYYGTKKRPGRVTVTTYNSVANLAGHVEAGALLICDECHRTDNDRMDKALDALKPAARIGLTATPGRLAKWDRILYDYSAKQALADGVIVPWIAHTYATESMLPVELDKACVEMTREAIGYGPTLIDAASIEDAEQFVAKLAAGGIRAAAIHSKLPDRISRDLPEKLRTGEIDALVHIDMLTEGADFPWLHCLVMRRPTASVIRFAQQVGRALRGCEGKTVAHLFDPLLMLDDFGLDFDAVFESDQSDEDLVAAEEKREREALKEIAKTYISNHHAMYALSRAARLAWKQVDLWPDTSIRGRKWREFEASAKQVDAMRRMAWVGRMRHAPDLEQLDRWCLRALADFAQRSLFSRGECADLLTLFHVVANHSRLFPVGCRPTNQQLLQLIERGAKQDANESDRVA